AELVGPERMREAGREVGLREVDLVRVVRREDRNEDAECDDCEEDGARDHRALVPHVPALRVAPEARLPGGRPGGLEIARERGVGRAHPLLLRGDDHQVRASRVRGSRTPYRMSTTMFASTTMIESSTVSPMTTE